MTYRSLSNRLFGTILLRNTDRIAWHGVWFNKDFLEVIKFLVFPQKAAKVEGRKATFHDVFLEHFTKLGLGIFTTNSVACAKFLRFLKLNEGKDITETAEEVGDDFGVSDKDLQEYLCKRVSKVHSPTMALFVVDAFLDYEDLSDFPFDTVLIPLIDDHLEKLEEVLDCMEEKGTMTGDLFKYGLHNFKMPNPDVFNVFLNHGYTRATFERMYHLFFEPVSITERKDDLEALRDDWLECFQIVWKAFSGAKQRAALQRVTRHPNKKEFSKIFEFLTKESVAQTKMWQQQAPL